MQESLVRFLGQEYPLEKIQATHFSILGFCGGSDSKELDCNAGDLGLIPGMGRSPGGGHRYPPQCSCLENPHGQRNLASYSPWGCKESDMTERLSTAQHKGIRTQAFPEQEWEYKRLQSFLWAIWKFILKSTRFLCPLIHWFHFTLQK